MTCSPRRRSCVPVGRARRAARRGCARLPAIDLIGASELLISWPSTRTSRCHAGALLLAQRPAHVGQHQQPVRAAVLPKSSARAPPSARRRPGRHASIVRGVSPSRHAAEPELLGACGRAGARPAGQQALAGAIHQPQPLRRRRRRRRRRRSPSMTRPQQRRRLQRAEPLRAQRLAEHVRPRAARGRAPSSGARAAGADGVVALAQRGEHVDSVWSGRTTRSRTSDARRSSQPPTTKSAERHLGTRSG